MTTASELAVLGILADGDARHMPAIIAPLLPVVHPSTVRSTVRRLIAAHEVDVVKCPDCDAAFYRMTFDGWVRWLDHACPVVSD